MELANSHQNNIYLLGNGCRKLCKSLIARKKKCSIKKDTAPHYINNIIGRMEIIKKIWNWFLSLFRREVIKQIFLGKTPVILGEIIKITSGKNHAWYESNVGKIRKPIQRTS
jgi:hypothetical protein